MIKDYWVHIPPHLFDVLQEIGGTTSEDFETVINAARAGFFNFTYPVPAGDKTALENFILNRYILRRIGSGNVKKWRQMFKGKMLEIMPFYARLMETEHFEFDPLINNDITTTDDEAGTLDYVHDKRTDNDYQYEKEGQTHREGTEDGTHADEYQKSGSETTSTSEVNRYSDTPQGDSSRIWEIDAQGHPVLNNIFLTDIRGITTNGNRSWSESGSDSGTTHGEHEEDTTYQEDGTDQRDIVEHETHDQDTTRSNENYKIGVSGSSKSKLVNEYRETFLRIYTDIATELEPLFYNLVEIDDILDFV